MTRATTHPLPVSHPAPHCYKIGWLRLLIGLFGAPTAWAMQINASEALASYACYPHEMPLSLPLWNWLYLALVLVSLLCFIAGSASASIAWLSWLRSRYEVQGGSAHAVDTGEWRTRFLCLFGAQVSFIFTVAIVFTGCAILIISPCQPWFGL